MRMRTLTENLTRKALFDASHAIVSEIGLRGLTVRGLAQRASVNLGSFAYHFGNREAFIRELIGEWYAPLFAKLRLETEANSDPVMRLRSMVLQLVDFLVDNGAFIGQLVMDAMADELGAQEFFASLPQRHPRLLLKTLKQAQNQKLLIKDDPLHMMMFIMTATGVPMIIVHGWKGKMGLSQELAAHLMELMLDRDRAARRLEWALKGLKPDTTQFSKED